MSDLKTGAGIENTDKRLTAHRYKPFRLSIRNFVNFIICIL